jgi:hypothetical protein
MFLSVSSSGVRSQIYFPQGLIIDVGINLSGRKRSVPKQFLDDTNVGAALQQMGSEAMTE